MAYCWEPIPNWGGVTLLRLAWIGLLFSMVMFQQSREENGHVPVII